MCSRSCSRSRPRRASPRTRRTSCRAHARACVLVPPRDTALRRGGSMSAFASQNWVAPIAVAVQPLRQKRNCIDVTAIVRLAPMGGAAITEKTRRLRIGAEPEVLDAFDFSTFEPRPDVAGQVEHRM